ncbi:MAG TPA: universal stress protein [Polyangiaceae bacterium]
MTTPAESVKKPYRIVVGFDLSELSERAVEEALEIARHRRPTELHVVTSTEPAGLLLRLPGETQGISDDAARETVRLQLTRVVDQNQAQLGPVGLERIAIYLVDSAPSGQPSRVITALAAEIEADLIIVGTHGRKGLSRALLGSVAAQVVRDATTNVYVVRPTDFIRGEKVPEIQPPLLPGQPHLKQFEHRRTYHYLEGISSRPSRIMPAS